jgi:hypothetical protein
MDNRTYKFEITWCYKEDGNRPDNIEEITEVSSTTVQRAISKLVRQLNEDVSKDDPDFLRASELLVIDVRTHQLTNAIIEHKRANGQPGV